MENQHPQTQFMPVVRQEEPSHYVNQYAQPVESHYQDVQQTSNPTSGFQNYQGPAAPMNRPPMSHQQEPASISSYAPDAQFSFAAKDGALGGDMNTAFPRHQGSTSTLVHQQEDKTMAQWDSNMDTPCILLIVDQYQWIMLRSHIETTQ